MTNGEEFNQAWRNIESRELFELDIDDNTLLLGWAPEGTNEDQQEIFGNVLVSSLAYRFLKAAWDYGELSYVVSINNIIVGFRSPFGWSFLTPNSYVAGNMPRNWRQLHDKGKEVLLQLLSETADSDYPDNGDN